MRHLMVYSSIEVSSRRCLCDSNTFITPIRTTSYKALCMIFSPSLKSYQSFFTNRVWQFGDFTFYFFIFVACSIRIIIMNENTLDVRFQEFFWVESKIFCNFMYNVVNILWNNMTRIIPPKTFWKKFPIRTHIYID